MSPSRCSCAACIEKVLYCGHQIVIDERGETGQGSGAPDCTVGDSMSTQVNEAWYYGVSPVRAPDDHRERAEVDCHRLYQRVQSLTLGEEPTPHVKNHGCASPDGRKSMPEVRRSSAYSSCSWGSRVRSKATPQLVTARKLVLRESIVHLLCSRLMRVLVRGDVPAPCHGRTDTSSCARAHNSPKPERYYNTFMSKRSCTITSGGVYPPREARHQRHMRSYAKPLATDCEPPC